MRSTKIRALLSAASLAAVLGAVQSRHPAAAPRSKSEPQAAMPVTAEQVVADIHKTNEEEIAMGTLAEQKGGSAKVKRYGQRLVRDHAFADKRMAKIAAKEGVTVKEAALDPESQMMMTKLEGLSGKEFDRAFLEAMAAGHRKALDKLTAVRRSLDDPRLSRFVAKLLPILNQHYRLATHLQGKASA